MTPPYVSPFTNDPEYARKHAEEALCVGLSESLATLMQARGIRKRALARRLGVKVKRIKRLLRDGDDVRLFAAAVHELGSVPKIYLSEPATVVGSDPVWHDATTTLPPHGELVLVLLREELGGSIHSCVVVAWCKHYNDSHLWVTPGGCPHLTAETHWEPIKRIVTHWSACLPPALHVPTWPGTKTDNGECVLPAAAADAIRTTPRGPIT